MRYHVHEPIVQRQAKRLQKLVERAGSVNAACIALNAALSFSSGYAPIYPNRLHAMLSKDLRKAINEDSLRLVKVALDKLNGIVRQPNDDDDLSINDWI
jgi:hypothetical protein